MTLQLATAASNNNNYFIDIIWWVKYTIQYRSRRYTNFVVFFSFIVGCAKFSNNLNPGMTNTQFICAIFVHKQQQISMKLTMQCRNWVGTTQYSWYVWQWRNFAYFSPVRCLSIWFILYFFFTMLMLFRFRSSERTRVLFIFYCKLIGKFSGIFIEIMEETFCVLLNFIHPDTKSIHEHRAVYFLSFLLCFATIHTPDQ